MPDGTPGGAGHARAKATPGGLSGKACEMSTHSPIRMPTRRISEATN